MAVGGSEIPKQPVGMCKTRSKYCNGIYLPYQLVIVGFLNHQPLVGLWLSPLPVAADEGFSGLPKKAM